MVGQKLVRAKELAAWVWSHKAEYVGSTASRYVAGYHSHQNAARLMERALMAEGF